ncbi:MAG: 2-C-methyl-D-erythritol 2,4-cyclodiphosphate synthase [Solirubrobacterales bacterium]|nr:2-C-methyl-D-erythritol 2,4-cyclodiphosphate synthase [Solirubrobacterales bacterium]
MSRTGIGYDVHRLQEGRRLVLGGVEIPHERGLEGHSDADVLCHAIIDALLGAAGSGDIGEHFPDSDDTWRGAYSLELLGLVCARLSVAGWRIGNVDSTVIIERPKLGPHRQAILTSLAEEMAVAADRVNVKFTTGEGMGFVGRAEGVAALAVATLDPAPTGASGE